MAQSCGLRVVTLLGRAEAPGTTAPHPAPQPPGPPRGVLCPCVRGAFATPVNSPPDGTPRESGDLYISKKDSSLVSQQIT